MKNVSTLKISRRLFPRVANAWLGCNLSYKESKGENWSQEMKLIHNLLNKVYTHTLRDSFRYSSELFCNHPKLQWLYHQIISSTLSSFKTINQLIQPEPVKNVVRIQYSNNLNRYRLNKFYLVLLFPLFVFKNVCKIIMTYAKLL